MNRNDATKILTILRVAYPTFYHAATEMDAVATANLWADIFREDDPTEVAVAVKALIATRTNNFPPTIGEVKEALQKNRSPDRMTEQEAWAIVSRAASRCDLQYPSRTFDKLPVEIQRAIGSPNVLREWALSDVSEFQTVIASNFQRSYRAAQQRSWEDAKLPQSIREALPGMNRAELPGG